VSFSHPEKVFGGDGEPFRNPAHLGDESRVADFKELAVKLKKMAKLAERILRCMARACVKSGF
jgi:hypothetical protein